MSNIYDLVKRYPWLPSFNSFYPNKETKDFIEELFDSENNHILKKRILTFFEMTFENIEEFHDYKSDELNIHLYILLRALLVALDNKTISNRVANLYSKTTYRELNKEKDYILDIIYKDLEYEILYDDTTVTYKKIKVKGYEESFKTNFKISFIDYLKLASNLKDVYRKLVNNALSEGYVYLKPKRINRLIQEHVRMKFLAQENIDRDKVNSLKVELLEIPEFKDFLDIIKDIWEKKKGDFDYISNIKFKEGEDISEIFPPCVKEILTKAKEGQNLIHTERLYILWFLNALEYPEEKIINVFSSLPDFDEEKTTYQVKYAMKKGYKPYSCKSLKSYNLCYAGEYKDNLCLGKYTSSARNEKIIISHPLTYIRIKQYWIQKDLKNSEN